MKIENRLFRILCSGAIVILFAGAAAGCTGRILTDAETEPAVVQGRVVFGPLQPVEIEGEPTPATPSEMFDDRWVLVYGPDGETLVAETPLQSDGSYRVELEPGEYVIGFTLIGIEFSKGLPAEIALAAGQVLDLDILVDTGIR